MKGILKNIINILVDIIMFAALYYGAYLGIVWVNNILFFVIWNFIVLGFITGLTPNKYLDKKKKFEMDGGNNFSIIYNAITNVLFVLTLAGLGHFVVAGFFAISKFLVHAKIKVIWQRKKNDDINNG